MRRFNTTSVGLDIGSRFIKVVELKRVRDTIVLNKFGIKEIPRDMNLDKDKIILQSISQLLSENNIKPHSVNIAAGGQSVFVRFVKLLHVKEDKLKQTMKFEAQNQIPFPLNDVAWDWSLLDKLKLATKKAVIVAIKKNLVEDMISKLKSIKLSTELIDVAPISLYNCMTFNEDYNEERLGAILDIGTKTTNLVIFKKGNIWIRSFPIAGERIEEGKEEGIEELLNEMERSLEYYFMQTEEEIQGRRKLDELILTGGGSAIKGIDSTLATRFNTKTTLLDPFRKLMISKDMFSSTQIEGVKNKLSLAVGLALREMIGLKIEVNFLREKIFERNLSKQKTLYGRLSIVMATLIVISFSMFMRQDYYVKRIKLDKVDEMLDIYRTYEPKIKKMQTEEDILKEKISILYNTASSRGIWLEIFRLLSEILPKEVWITDVSGIVSMEQGELGRLDISGKALSYQSVNNFVSSLKSLPSLKDVKPISSSIELDSTTKEEIVKFNVTMDVVIGES